MRTFRKKYVQSIAVPHLFAGQMYWGTVYHMFFETFFIYVYWTDSRTPSQSS